MRVSSLRYSASPNSASKASHLCARTTTGTPSGSTASRSGCSAHSACVRRRIASAFSTPAGPLAADFAHKWADGGTLRPRAVLTPALLARGREWAFRALDTSCSVLRPGAFGPALRFLARANLTDVFLVQGGMHRILCAAGRDGGAGQVTALCAEALRHADWSDFVTHAPSLVGALGRLSVVSPPDALELVRLLARHGGTHFVLRLLEHPRGESVLRHAESRMSPADADALCALWPERLAPLLGRPPSARAAAPDAPECPITLAPCVDPVCASDGYVYERDAILTHIANGGASPMTRAELHPRVAACADV